jgi:hypothetical protein
MNTINFVNNKNNRLENGMNSSIIEKNNFSVNIVNHTTSLNKASFSLSTHNKEVRLEQLHSIKSVLKDSFSSIELPINSDFATTGAFEKLKVLFESEFDDADIESIPDELKLKERLLAMEFFNPNHKIFSRKDERAYAVRAGSINTSLLPEDEKRQLDEYDPYILYRLSSLEGKALNGFDKRNDFDSVIDSAYFAKRTLEITSEYPDLLSDKDKKKIVEDIETLEQVNEKVLLISQDSTSIKEKENLRGEIAALLENFDSSLLEEVDALHPDESFAPKLLNDLDNIIDKQKEEFEELSMGVLNINSMSEAIKYQEQIEKLDANFDDLFSNEEKENYLQNKQDVIFLFKFAENKSSDTKEDENNGLKFTQKTTDENSVNMQNTKDYSEFKEKLDQEFVKVREQAEKEIFQLLNFVTHDRPTDATAEILVFGAQKYLDLSDKWSSIIDQGNVFEKHTNEWGKMAAKHIIENPEEYNITNNVNKELELMIENIDKLIYLFELNEENPNWNDKNMIDYNKDSSAFDASNIKAKNGSFVLSNNSNINSSNVYSLISQ